MELSDYKYKYKSLADAAVSGGAHEIAPADTIELEYGLHSQWISSMHAFLLPFYCIVRMYSV